MKKTLLKTMVLIPALLAAACGLDEDSHAGPFEPATPVAPEASYSVVASDVEGFAMFAGPVSLVRETGRPEIVPVPLGDFSRFQSPFTLIVDKTGDSAESPLAGFILLDGEPFVSPSDFAVGSSTVEVDVPLGPGSTLEIQLLGPIGAEVSVRVEGAIQPPPTIEITSPARAAMLAQGTNSVSPVQITGQACHPVYPITSLEIDGQDVPVSGANLCEPFSVTQQSVWGNSVITGRAENARGRVGTVVQSYLRSPTYGVAALTADPSARIPGGFLAQLNQAALDDDNDDLDDMAELVERAFDDAAVDAQVATVISPFECYLEEQLFGVCLFSASVHRDGGITYGGPSVNLTPMSGRLAARVQIRSLAIPLRVETNLGTFHGTLRADSIVSSADLTFLPSGVSVSSVNATTHHPTVDFANLPAWMESPLNAIWSGQLRITMEDVIEDGSRQALHDVADDILGLEMETSATILGTQFSVSAALDVPTSHSGFLRLGLSPQVYPTSPVASPPPSARGPIALLAAKPAIGAGVPALTVGARDDVINQALWAAWQAGVFHVADSEALTGIDVAGVSGVSVTPNLPPVLMDGGGGALANVGWGDVEVSATVDPAIFGLPGGDATPIAVTAYVSSTTTLAIGFDEVSQAVTIAASGFSVDIQIETPDDLLDEAGIAASLEQLLEDLSETLTTAAVVAIPVPYLDYSVPGVTPVGSVMRLEGTTTDRPSGWIAVGGEIVNAIVP